MIPQARKSLIATIFILSVLLIAQGSALCDGYVSEEVIRVIDGDTMEMMSGERVRLLGIDAPEKGDPLFVPAKKRLEDLTVSGKVNLEVCEDRDIYGRVLATASVEKININQVLLEEGLALPMLIPPCGRPVAAKILSAAGTGALSGKGVYSLKEYRVIPHWEAGDYIGEKLIVRGRIANIHKGRKALHLNFGSDWKTDFTAVLFRDGQRRFIDLGIDPGELAGTEVLVIGKVKRYNGPEIIVRGPDQVIPLKGIMDEKPKSKIQDEYSPQ